MRNKMGLEKIANKIGTENFRIRIEARIKNAALIKAREELGLTQTEAAEKIGIYTSLLSMYERLRAYPSQETQYKICDFYGFSKEEVFPDELRAFAKNSRELVKLVAERDIPKENLNLISLSAVKQNLLPSYNPEDEILERLSNEKIIPELLKILSPKQEYVVKRRFGLDNKAPYTLEQTAEKIGCCGANVRVIEERAFEKMRFYAKRKKIRL
jgi:transcriptional regulator with XRE-family HTH domain